MQLTMAICTYERPQMLQRTLTSLCDCEAAGNAWELLLVDNAGNREIEAIAEQFTDRLPVRYAVEPQLGTSHARNLAVRLAKAPVVLFTDDDVTFDRHWLQRMNAAISEHDQYAFWGGRVEPVWNRPPPPWFEPRLCPMLADMVVRYQRGEQPRPWQARRDPPFYTANLALRVEAINRAGGFDTRVGHRGSTRMGMEDSLMIQAIVKQQGQGWYAADAIVHHPVQTQRLTKKDARHFAWRQGWLSAHMHKDGGQRRVPLWFYRAASGKLIGGACRWLSGSVTANAGLAFAGQFIAINNSSKIWHAARPNLR